MKDKISYRIDYNVDKFLLTRLAERYIYHCKYTKINVTKSGYNAYVRNQLYQFGMNQELEPYNDLTRLAMKFLVKNIGIKFY